MLQRGLMDLLQHYVSDAIDGSGSARKCFHPFGACAKRRQDLRIGWSCIKFHTCDCRVLPGQLGSAGRGSKWRRWLVWKSDHGGSSPDVEWYSEHIAPRLPGLSLIEIARAVGVSTSSASKFRRGLRVPAPRHWATLASLGEDFR
jgi:hypothetical protein